METIWTQAFPPANAEVTEHNIPDQTGKVVLITGANSGIGFHLACILYGANADVYITTRTKDKAESTIARIRENARGEGKLTAIELELGDFDSIRSAAKAFQSKECRLDILFNNAGIGLTPGGLKTKQGHEIHIGSNVIGPFLFTKLLVPQLQTANSGRIIWTGSMLVDAVAPKNGLDLADFEKPPNDLFKLYTMTKVAHWFLASEFGRRHERVISVVQNPGNLRTGVWRNVPWLVTAAFQPILYEARNGAHTALWAGLSPEVTAKCNGRYIIPWGRWHPSPRQDIVHGLKTQEEGGSGLASDFWDWCVRQIQ